MREAVQHRPALRKPRHSLPVEPLVQKKTRFLAILHVHSIADPVFHNFRQTGVRPGQVQRRKVKPALVFLQPLPGADGNVVALVQAVDLPAVVPQQLYQQRKEHGLDALDAHRERLCHQIPAETVHRQAGEQVGLAEDDTAARNLPAQHCFAVLPRVGQSAQVKRLVEDVIGIA